MAPNRKSGGKPTLVVTLRVKASTLRELIAPIPAPVDSPSKDTSKPIKASPPLSTNGAADNASDSNAATPAADGTPAPSAMGPPTEVAKKKGTKRAAETGADGTPKSKGRPGPKKKPRLEDGTTEVPPSRPSAHKLGPKANQGAINAGLRALDRSGKPCRKWARGGFTMKSFTGVVWQIPRWTAPPKRDPEASTDDSAATASASAADNSSGKENKGLINGEGKSNSGVGEPSSHAPSVQPSSPAAIAVASAS